MKLLKCILFALSLFIIRESHSQYTWEEVDVPDSIEVMMNAFDSTGNQFIASNHGVYFSVNGYDWEQTSHTNYESYIYINELNTIYTGMTYLYRSFNIGITWDSIFYSSEGGIMNICTEGDSAILIGTWGGIYRSIDNGQIWLHVLDTYNSEVIKDMVFDSGGIYYAGSTSYNGISPGGIYRSFDNGVTWSLCCLEYHFISSIEINSEDEIFVGTKGHGYNGGGGVFKSSNAGETWDTMYYGNLVVCMTLNEFDDIAIGCSSQDGATGGVFVTYDNGLNWSDITANLPSRDIYQLRFGIDNHLYAITKYDYKLFKTDIPVVIKELPLNSDFNHVKIYPNPANNSLSIIPIKGNINLLRITDIYGHQIYELIKANQTGLINFNIENLVPGLYFLEVSDSLNRSNAYKFLKY